MVFAIVLAVVRPLSGRLADRWGYLRTATLGLVLVAAGLVILALAENLALILAAGAVYGIGYGTSQPSLQALTVHGVAPARRGAAMAAFFFAYDMGIALGSIGAGFLASWISLSGVYWVALVPATIDYRDAGAAPTPEARRARVRPLVGPSRAALLPFHRATGPPGVPPGRPRRRAALR